MQPQQEARSLPNSPEGWFFVIGFTVLFIVLSIVLGERWEKGWRYWLLYGGLMAAAAVVGFFTLL